MHHYLWDVPTHSVKVKWSHLSWSDAKCQFNFVLKHVLSLLTWHDMTWCDNFWILIFVENVFSLRHFLNLRNYFSEFCSAAYYIREERKIHVTFIIFTSGVKFSNGFWVSVILCGGRGNEMLLNTTTSRNEYLQDRAQWKRRWRNDASIAKSMWHKQQEWDGRKERKNSGMKVGG